MRPSLLRRCLNVFALVGAVGLAGTHCARVTFIGDGQYGDAGLARPDAGVPDAAMGSTSSSSSSSSGGSGGASSTSGPTCPTGPGPQPVFQVTPADVTSTWRDTWSGSACVACHGGSENITKVFTPPMPADVASDLAGTAAALTAYCQPPAGTGDVGSIDPTTSALGQVHLLCVLTSPAPADSNHPCNHNGGVPGNTETFAAVEQYGTACRTAIERYRVNRSIWLDGGFAPDCGTPGSGSSSSAAPSSSAPAEPSCTSPAVQAAWDTAWIDVGGTQSTCANCHNGGYTGAECFPVADKAPALVTFCDYFKQEDGTYLRGGWTTSRLYRATLSGSTRYACPQATIPHDGFTGMIAPQLKAVHDAIFP